MRPPEAIQVRADQVQLKDDLWVEGESVGLVDASEPRDGNSDDWDIGTNGREPWTDITRNRDELVWVVRAPVLHTITLQLTEPMIRVRAELAYIPPDETQIESVVLDAVDRACAEWVTQHDQETNP